ncbi:MAG: SPOR domain-containing protein [Candidatus Sulfotelmatobacter sp.]
MATSQDTEITLGTTKLLGLFFGLVATCAVFFALGYTFGRKADSGIGATGMMAPLAASNGAKPAGAASSSSSSTPMTFYKAVEQQNANPQLAPASTAGGTANAAGAQSSGTAASPAPTTSPSDTTSPGSRSQSDQAANAPDPMAPIPGTGYFVQVAAVTKQEDADSLVDALKKKQYPAFVANNATDKLFRVQLGPFGDIKEAEATRSRLINDGYNPILKK